MDCLLESDIVFRLKQLQTPSTFKSLEVQLQEDMAASHHFSPGSAERIGHTQQIEDFLAHLMLDPDREQVVSELQGA